MTNTDIPLRVMSYNIAGGRYDRSALTGLVRDLAPDVLIVQEAPRRLRWRTRCAALAHECHLVYAAGGMPSMGNVIMTSLRVQVRQHWALRYPLTPGRHLRGAVFARCSVGAASIVVAGSHLATDPAERPGQAAALAVALTGDLAGPPVVLGVDVNEPPGQESWQVLAGSLRDAAGPDEPATYPASAPRVRLDAIMVDPGVRVLDHRVVDSPPARRASDHLPIVVDLALRA